MFLSKIVFLAVCLSVCGLIEMAADKRFTLPFDDRQSLWIHCDLLNVLTFSNLVSSKVFPFGKPLLWCPTNVAAFSVATSQNLVCEHTKCLCLTGILLCCCWELSYSGLFLFYIRSKGVGIFCDLYMCSREGLLHRRTPHLWRPHHQLIMDRPSRCLLLLTFNLPTLLAGDMNLVLIGLSRIVDSQAPASTSCLTV